MNKPTIIWAAAALLVISSSAISIRAMAAELPDYYPKSFEKTGTIDLAPTPNNTVIVISDSSLNLSPGLQVHTPMTKNGSINLLKSGQKIGFRVTGTGPTSKGSVAEIWILPPSKKPGLKR